MTQTQFTLSPQLVAALDAFIAARGFDRNEFVEQALTEALRMPPVFNGYTQEMAQRDVAERYRRDRQ